jgi:hypothetical protein
MAHLCALCRKYSIYVYLGKERLSSVSCANSASQGVVHCAVSYKKIYYYEVKISGWHVGLAPKVNGMQDPHRPPQHHHVGFDGTQQGYNSGSCASAKVTQFKV